MASDMKKISRWILIFAFFYCANIESVNAQNFTLDSASNKNAENTAISYFNEFIGQESWLYNGPSYEFFKVKTDNSAFFQDVTSFGKGSVIYNGYRYDNIPLLYDIYNDLVVSIYHNGFSKYSLISERLSEFYLNNHHFVYLQGNSNGAKTPLKGGFFDLIYDGKLQVLVKRSKILQETIGSSEIRNYFILKADYYLKKDGVYYPISKERSFLNHFKDQKSEFKKQLNIAGIKFKNDPERAMIILADYYDNQTK